MSGFPHRSCFFDGQCRRGADCTPLLSSVDGRPAQSYYKIIIFIIIAYTFGSIDLAENLLRTLNGRKGMTLTELRLLQSVDGVSARRLSSPHSSQTPQLMSEAGRGATNRARRVEEVAAA